jgi:uncharacterized protein (DUF2235 family)
MYKALRRLSRAMAPRERDQRGPEKANPKRLVVFCDGTWNDLRMPHLTNVARLAKCVSPTGKMTLPDETERIAAQVVYYDEGVGVSDSVSRLADRLVRLEGGALGRGLDSKIEKAYRFIVLNYDPGDEIFIFGFSRGAYTARSLCGLIRKCGVLRRSEFENIPAALDLYRDDTKPWHADAQAFRRRFSWPLIAGEEDYTDDDRAEIEAFKAKAGVHPHIRVIPPDIRRRGFHVRYLGVWDTVGSLGVPKNYRTLYALTHDRYRFHDEEASSWIESLRHAVALDEERATFDVTPVTNIHDLNILWAAAAIPPAQVDDPHAKTYVPYNKRLYQQRWFPGDHGAVGGGNPEPGLSSAGLLWIAEGAELMGLKLDRGPGSELSEALRLAQACANWKINKDGTPRSAADFDVLRQVGGVKRRAGPMTFDEIHESARERWRRDSSYRPAGMMRFIGMPDLAP